MYVCLYVNVYIYRFTCTRKKGKENKLGAGEEGGAAVTEVRAVWGTRDDPCPSRKKQVQMCTIDVIYCFIASRKCWVTPSINTVAS